MKLDNLSNQVYIVALNEARMQNHEYVTPEHFLYAALMFETGKELVSNSGGDHQGISEDLGEFFETKMTPADNDNPIDSWSFVQMFEIAVAKVNAVGNEEVTIGDILVSIMSLHESYGAYVMQKNGVNKSLLVKNVAISSSKANPESTQQNNTQTPKQEQQRSGHNHGDQSRSEQADREFLNTFTVNLTQKAKENKLDPFYGREEISARTVLVLCRRLKNNPVLVGDPGVGKTAIIEGLAQRIASGDVPAALEGCQILHLDMPALLSGTKYRGDFEERLVKLINIIAKTEKPIVYIDEIHSVVGVGQSGGGGMDAAGILKPYLLRGDLRFIGTTTFEEYKKYFDKERALARRFQKIDVDEPTLEECIEILQSIKHRYEAYHNVSYGDGIIKHICTLSQKHLKDRFMPDSAIDVMDETGANLRYKDKTDFMHIVTERDVERSVAAIAKIPERSLSGDETEKLRNLESDLSKRIFGQDKAVAAVVGAIKSARSGLNNPDKPVANLFFVGPSGVGKTEIAKQLAKCLGLTLHRYDMSEYQEKHSVARLIGAPPGYIGYETGGLLTDAIRRTPSCVLLLDEVEKAHPDIMNVLLQVMDYGVLTDSSGKKSDFRNVVLIMTSNVGASELNKRVIGYSDELNTGAIDTEFKRLFTPEFRNRLDEVVIFNALDERMAERIARRTLEEITVRVRQKGTEVEFSEGLVEWLWRKGFTDTYGAREIIRVAERCIKRLLVDEVLFGDKKERIKVDIKEEEPVISE